MIPKKKLIKNVECIINDIDPDLVNVHHAFSPMTVTIPKAISINNIPKILTNHSVPICYDIYRSQWSKIARLLSVYTVLKHIRHYDRFIAVSRIAADFIKNFVNKTIYIIPNGVDLEEFNVKGSKEDFNISEDTNLFIMVGRSTLKKGYELGLLTFKHLLKHYPNSMLLIAGPTGWIAKYITVVSKILRISDKVKVLGFIPRERLIKLYNAADVFLHFPWGGESFGIVLLEAMASGTPIVASSGDGLKYILEKSKAGIVVTSYNAYEIVKAIIKVLKNDNLREELIVNGKKFAERYSWFRLVKHVDKVYKMALHGE